MGAKATAATLDRLPSGAHCPSCNIDYGRDFTRNVELTFQPAPAIRPLTEGEYCLAGPMTTPHVQVQQTLEPGEVRSLSVRSPAGSWRLRTLEPGESVDLDWQALPGEGFPLMMADGDKITLGSASAPPACSAWRTALPIR